MRVRISHLVNSLTRQALFERVPGYVSIQAIEAEARDRFDIERLHRFDLGENPDGCSPRVLEFIRSLTDEDLLHYLCGYPESTARLKHQPPRRAARVDRSGDRGSLLHFYPLPRLL
jgi:hypothetical protein